MRPTRTIKPVTRRRAVAAWFGILTLMLSMLTRSIRLTRHYTVARFYGLTRARHLSPSELLFKRLFEPHPQGQLTEGRAHVL